MKLCDVLLRLRASERERENVTLYYRTNVLNNDFLKDQKLVG